MKNKEDLKIIFMGTPEFAVTILNELIQNQYNIQAVVTAPDRPAGRGRKIQESAVKSCAKENSIPVLQPTNLRDEDFLEELKSFNADLFIVVAFRMLPKVVWEIPPMGTFNLHGSLLPEYRGAAPINWAVINGETKTGVTTFFIDEKIDTGEIILSREMEIGSEETAGELHDRMMFLGAKTVAETVELIRTNKAERTPQPDGELKAAPKIFKQDCYIDFNKTIQDLHNFIRGMSPYPTAWMNIKQIGTEDIKSLKIFRATIIDDKPNATPSLIIQEKKLILKTYNGALELKEVQLEGKRRLDASAFIAGFKAEEWIICP